jgi:GT2 family glycosyltransferase
VPETVAIVTPTHQRRRSLERVLDGLAKQSCPVGFYSVVVVCDGCTDGTLEMLRGSQYPFPLRVLEQSPGQGPAAARNRALSSVSAPIVLFIDDDVLPTEQLVAVHAARHAEESDLVVIGPLLAPQGRQQPWIRWEADTLKEQYREMTAGAWAPTPRQFYTGNASVRTEHVLGAGGFDARFARGEDVDLAFRLERRGLRFVFDSRAVGIHCARRSFESWVDAANEYGRVELAMGRVWDTHGLVDVKAREFRRRHPIVRQIVALGLVFPRSVPALITCARVAGRALAETRVWSLARGAYTTIFELAYWRGVEQAVGVRGSALERIRGKRPRLDGGSEKAPANR